MEVQVLIPSLPNDVPMIILARVPRQYHAVLSAVSKAIRSAVSSPHFFALRTLLNLTEILLYLRVGSDHHIHENWFAVHRKPNPIIHNNNNNLLQLSPVPPIPLPAGTYMRASAYAAVGPKIYVLGGCTYYVGTELYYMPQISSDVWVLDCRSHTWERGPSMLTSRYYAKAVVVYGKVYVVGGSPENLWVEVLDPALGRWEAIPSPLEDFAACSFGCKLVDGKISICMKEKDFKLDPRTKTWEVLQNEEPFASHSCEVDGVSYRYGREIFERFDEKVGAWEEVKGVMEGKPKYLCEPELLNLKGRLVMVFGEVKYGDKTDLKKEGRYGVWCAEIDVTQNGDGDWYGKTHWSEKVRLFPDITCRIPEVNFDASAFPYVCNSLSVSL